MNLAEKFKQFATEEASKPVDNGRVLIVDGLNTYLRSFAATPTMNEDGQHVGGVTGFLLSVAAAVRQFKPSRLVVAFDGAGGSQRRRQFFPEYKANRRSMTKLNRTYDFQTLEQEQEAMKWQLKLLITFLRNLPVTVMAPDLVEADDVIAYVAQTVVERGGRAIILSTDKDFLQLVNENIMVYNPVKKKMYDPASVVMDYGFHPNNFLLYRVVTGDKSDGIPGIEGIKEKTLLKYFPQLAEEEKKDINFIIENATTQIESVKKPPVALQTLVQSRNILDRNIKLMRLDNDMAMSGAIRIDVLNMLDKPVGNVNQYELTKLAISCKMIHAFGRFEEWLMVSFLPLTRHTLGK